MRTRFAPLLIGSLAGAVVAGGISYAAIPHSSTKQITACILKSGTNKGAARIIDAQRGATCRSTETKIEWAATGVNWRGNWSAGATYNTNDVVYYQGTGYRARRTNNNITPGTSSTDWLYLARQGATGPQGPAGPTGPAGADGTDGQDATLDRPGHTSTNVDDPFDIVGIYTSLAIGEDGLPIVAHNNVTNSALRVTHCNDIACATATNTTIDDPANSVGTYTSIAIGNDGLPIISHSDSSAGALRVTHCDNITCTTATSTTIDDPANSVGTYTSIAIGTDGLPIISHRNASTAALRVSHCDDTACTTATSNDVDDPANGVGNYTSIAIGTDGLPIISHYETGANALRVSHCDDVACTTATSTTIDDPANSVGAYTSIAIGTDGLPIISHRNASTAALRVSHCDDVACTSATSTTIDDPANNVGAYTSIAVGTDGLPIISHQDGDAPALRITRCLDRTCSVASSVNADGPGVGGSFGSIAIGTDGLPIISFSRSGNHLRITHCSNRFCLPYHRAR